MNYKNITVGKLHRLPFTPTKILEGITEAPPKRILFWKINTDFDRMKFVHRNKLMEEISEGNLFYSVYSRLTKVPIFILKLYPIKKTYPFVKLVIEDLKMRNKRDERLQITYTQEEINAGIKNIGQGIYGIIRHFVIKYFIQGKKKYGYSAFREVEQWSDNFIYADLKDEMDKVRFQREYNKQLNKKK